MPSRFSLNTSKIKLFSVNRNKNIMKIWFNDIIYNDKCYSMDSRVKLNVKNALKIFNFNLVSSTLLEIEFKVKKCFKILFKLNSIL